MERGLSGHYVPISTVGEVARAFVPSPLPPSPPVEFDFARQSLLNEASAAVGRLDGIALLLPDPQFFLYSYIRKEAVLSSQIEGTQSSLSDLLLFEAEAAPGVPLDDVQEVSSYVAAVEHGLTRLQEGFPLSLRLLREIHAVLLSNGRGRDKQPGEFKRSQNWIGGSRPGTARFVPPPPDLTLECMGALENFLHGRPEPTPVLFKAALAHVQFETIHPFLDGNGRLGRLLITLLLCEAGTLRQPLLYLSLYLKQNRETYYELLQRVRLTGDWEAWVDFFLIGVRDTANQAVETTRRLLDLFRRDRETLSRLGKSSGSAIQVHDQLQRRPVIAAPRLAAASGLSVPTARTVLNRLEHLGLVRELTGGKYGRLYAYDPYLTILNEGMEPL